MDAGKTEQTLDTRKMDGGENARTGFQKAKNRVKASTERRQPLQDISQTPRQSCNVIPAFDDLTVKEKFSGSHKKSKMLANEGATRKRWSSGNLEDFLTFEPTEMPKWRKETLSAEMASTIPSISVMLKDIVQYKNTFQKMKKPSNKTQRRQVLKSLLLKFLCNVQKEENIGVKEEGKTKEIMKNLDHEIDKVEGDRKRKLSDSLDDTNPEKKLHVDKERNESPEFETYPSIEDEFDNLHGQIDSSGKKPSKTITETKNLYTAYRHIVGELNESKSDTSIDEESNQINETIDCKGVIDLDSLIIDTHRILMEDVMKEGQTPGRFSTKARQTEFNGKEYFYPTYVEDRFADKAVETMIDKINDIMDTIKSKNASEEEKAKLFFKCSGLFLFGFLTLHPFPDGNGRLARLLASYDLLTFSPFMTPIYNVFSSSRECDYIQALVDTGEDFLTSERKITAEDEAVKLAISVIRQKPCDLCAMLIESNWTVWRQLLVNLGDRSIKLFEWEKKNQQFLSETFEAAASPEYVY